MWFINGHEFLTIVLDFNNIYPPIVAVVLKFDDYFPMYLHSKAYIFYLLQTTKMAADSPLHHMLSQWISGLAATDSPLQHILTNQNCSQAYTTPVEDHCANLIQIALNLITYEKRQNECYSCLLITVLCASYISLVCLL